VVATMISRMVGTPAFSDRTEFSVSTAEFHAPTSLSEWRNPPLSIFIPRPSPSPNYGPLALFKMRIAPTA
jgi:hypothetical protein